TRCHSFVRWTFLQIGISQLEKARVNISATLEQIENYTADALLGLHQEITALSKAAIQNRMGLDILLAKEGGLCTIINQTCRIYVNQENRIEIDLQ
ncbi:ERVV2 protein, partial [Crotophaga sulcirostris]|nr:ERVV2 protein [Crotophaga sulcirostris]